MKKIIFLLFGIILLVSCSEKKQKTTDEKKNEAICIWDGASIRQEASSDSKWLSSISFGEKVTLLGESKIDTEQYIQYSKIKLSDGKEGWVSANLIIPNGKLAAITEKTVIYKRPDLLTGTDKSFNTLDVIVVTSESNDWLEVFGNQKIKSGWIKKGSVTDSSLDVSVALLASIALAEKDPGKKNKKLKDITTNPDFQGSVFIDDVNDKIDPFEIKKIIQVKNVNEFLNAIGSDVKIEITAEIIISDLPDSSLGAWDGEILTISEVKNLIIKGINQDHSSILTDFGWVDVLYFKNSENILLENLSIGHTVETGCQASVIAFYKCHNVYITNCDLYGSGEIGLNLNEVKNSHIGNSVIRDCSSSIIECDLCDDITFDEILFKNNSCWESAFYFYQSSDIEFGNSEITNNNSVIKGESFYSTTLFNIDENSKVTLKYTGVNKNTFGGIYGGGGYLDYDGTNYFESNYWDEEYYEEEYYEGEGDGYEEEGGY